MDNYRAEVKNEKPASPGGTRELQKVPEQGEVHVQNLDTLTAREEFVRECPQTLNMPSFSCGQI